MKRLVKERLFNALREEFKHHPVYTWNENLRATKITIDEATRETGTSIKFPAIVIPDITLSFGSLALGNAGADPLQLNKGVVNGFNRTYSVQMRCALSVYAYKKQEVEQICDDLCTLIYVSDVFASALNGEVDNLSYPTMNPVSFDSRSASVYECVMQLSMFLMGTYTGSVKPPLKVQNASIQPRVNDFSIPQQEAEKLFEMIRVPKDMPPEHKPFFKRRDNAESG